MEQAGKIWRIAGIKSFKGEGGNFKLDASVDGEPVKFLQNGDTRILSGLTLPAAVARERHRKTTPNHESQSSSSSPKLQCTHQYPVASAVSHDSVPSTLLRQTNRRVIITDLKPVSHAGQVETRSLLLEGPAGKLWREKRQRRHVVTD